MFNLKNNTYQKPFIRKHQILMEEGIATSSSTINVGPGYEPKIEEWDNSPTGHYHNFDI